MTPMETGIIETKLQPPQMAHRSLRREAIGKSLLDAAENGRTVTVVAPAGSGKSTLLSAHFRRLQDQGFSCHWLSLDQTNDDPMSFTRYLCLALAPLDAGFFENLLAQLRANSDAELDANLESIVPFLAGRARKLAIFFDDFHTINNPKVKAFVGRLLKNIASSTHIVIASRSAVQVELGHRRMAGTLLEVGAPDLNLDHTQLQQFMKQVHNLSLDGQQIEALHTATEGWMAGLQLAAMAIKSDVNRAYEIIEGFSGRDKNLKEYLFQTVFDVQPADLREFLLLTAPLSKLSVGLCNAVTSRNDSQQFLDRIDQANLFLIPLDHQGVWYRYHHLFSEFLQRELMDSSDHRNEDVLDAAARWCVEQGLLTDAIQYLLDSERYDDAAELINENATAVALDEGEHATILDWMRRLPKDLHDTNPRLLLNHAWSRAFSRDITTAMALCDRAHRLLNEPPPQPLNAEQVADHESLKWYERVVRVLANAAIDNTESGIKQCSELVAELPDSELVLIASMVNTKGYCHFVRQELAETQECAARAYKYAQSGGSVYSSVWGVFLGGMVDIERGRLEAARESFEKAQNCIAQANVQGAYVKALAALLGAELAVQRCDFAIARNMLVDSHVLSTLYGPIVALISAFRCEARQQAWSGSLGLARKVLHRGQDIGLSTNQPRLFAALVAEEIALQLQFDCLESARDTLRRTDLLSAQQGALSQEVQPLIEAIQEQTKARMLVAENQHDEALALLRRLISRCEVQSRCATVLHLKTLRAIVLWRLDKQSEAIREIDRIVSVASVEGQYYPVVSAGRGLVAVIDEITDRQDKVDERDTRQTEKRAFLRRARKLICGELEVSKTHPEPETTVASAENDGSAAGDTFSERETELLRLLALGFRNQELADELFLSLATVKWHLHNIYMKLGVKNRVAAIAAARKLQLI